VAQFNNKMFIMQCVEP